MDFLKRTANACLAIASFFAVVTACTTDAYDTGDGSLSYMRADFVEASTDSKANVISAVTDDGKALLLSSPLTASWITAKDSTYRALLYYNNVEQGSSDHHTVKPITIRNVIVPSIIDVSHSTAVVPTDPVVYDTSWLSGNHKYLNLGIYLKTGKVDDDAAVQKIGLAYMGTSMQADGTKVHKLKLIHDQGTVPEYYSTQVYVSIPIYKMSLADGEAVVIRVNTYKGEVEKKFTIKRD